MRVAGSLLASILLVGCFDLGRTWDGGATSDLAGDRSFVDLLAADGPRAEAAAGEASAPDLPSNDLGPDQPQPLKDWVTIPAGTFLMGSPTSEQCRQSGTETLHSVTLTHTFEIMTAEVTQDEFQQEVGHNPSAHSNCPTCPVENVTWEESANYCNLLSAASGLATCYVCKTNPVKTTCTVAPGYLGQGIYSCPGYRLPTDAEWEYAYRAKTTTPLYNGKLLACTVLDLTVDKIAWYKWNSTDKTHPGRQKAANAWGLHDVAGNVEEWCHDGWQDDLGQGAQTDPVTGFNDDKRVVRGGAYDDEPRYVRAAGRAGIAGWDNSGRRGLRCVRTLSPVP